MKSFLKNILRVFVALCMCSSLVPAMALGAPAEGGTPGASDAHPTFTPETNVDEESLGGLDASGQAKTSVWVSVEYNFQITENSSSVTNPKDTDAIWVRAEGSAYTNPADFEVCWHYQMVQPAEDGVNPDDYKGEVTYSFTDSLADGASNRIAFTEVEGQTAQFSVYPSKVLSAGSPDGEYEFWATVKDKTGLEAAFADTHKIGVVLDTSDSLDLTDNAELLWKDGAAATKDNFTWWASTKDTDGKSVASVISGATLSGTTLNTKDESDNAVEAFVEYIADDKAELVGAWGLRLADYPADTPIIRTGKFYTTLDATDALKAALGDAFDASVATEDKLNELTGALSLLWYEPKDTDAGTTFTVRELGAGDSLSFYKTDGGKIFASFMLGGESADLGSFALCRTLPPEAPEKDSFSITSDVYVPESGPTGGLIDPLGASVHAEGTYPTFSLTPSSDDYYVGDILISVKGKSYSYAQNNKIDGGENVQKIGTLDGDEFTFSALARENFGFSESDKSPFSIGITAQFVKKDTGEDPDSGLTEPEDPTEPPSPDNPLVPKRVSVNVNVGNTLTSPDNKTLIELWSGDKTNTENKVADLKSGAKYINNSRPATDSKFDISKPISLKFASIIEGSQVDYVLVKTKDKEGNLVGHEILDSEGEPVLDAAGNPVVGLKYTPDKDGWVSINNFYDDVEIDVLFKAGTVAPPVPTDVKHNVLIDVDPCIKSAKIGEADGFSASVSDGDSPVVTVVPNAGYRVASANISSDLKGDDAWTLTGDKTFDAEGVVSFSLPSVKYDTRLKFILAPIEEGGDTVKIETPGPTKPGDGPKVPGTNGDGGNGTSSVVVQGQDPTRPGSTIVHAGDEVTLDIVPTTPDSDGFENKIEDIVVGDDVIFHVPDGVIVGGDGFNAGDYIVVPDGWTCSPTPGSEDDNGIYTFTKEDGKVIVLDTTNKDGNYKLTYENISEEDIENGLVHVGATKTTQFEVDVVTGANTGSATDGGTYSVKSGDGKAEDKVITITPFAGYDLDFVYLDSETDTRWDQIEAFDTKTRNALSQRSTFSQRSSVMALSRDIGALPAEEAADAKAASATYYEYTIPGTYYTSKPKVDVRIGFKTLGGATPPPSSGGDDGDSEQNPTQPEAGTYTLTALVAGTGHGKVLENSTQVVKRGSSFTFHFVPETSAYRVVSIKLDNLPSVSYTSTSYTFTNVDRDHTLVVEFGPVAYSGDNSSTARAIRHLQRLAQTGDIQAPIVLGLLTVAFASAGVAIIVSSRATCRRKERKH
ncbi:hypothetical protein [Adlercreutzia sp. ZJ304]|uniref:hypothetical protein n=1 Tax=Adlercreutzia sp. ZJ304 TaxID=2709791 RepID=UPI0013EDF1C5|nr:hypothetical protein [Adlercreutzia sp. ZJ304]